MYSPKIREELIPKLYRISKEQGKPMTRFVNGIIAEALEKYQNDKVGVDADHPAKIKERQPQNKQPGQHIYCCVVCQLKRKI